MLEDILVPIGAFALTFGIIYLIVTARNRERMAMIEKGINPKDFLSKPHAHSILKWALFLIGVGVGIFIGSLLDSYTTLQDEAVYFAPIMLFGGLGLLGAFLIAKRAEQA